MSLEHLNKIILYKFNRENLKNYLIILLCLFLLIFVNIFSQNISNLFKIEMQAIYIIDCFLILGLIGYVVYIIYKSIGLNVANSFIFTFILIIFIVATSILSLNWGNDGSSINSISYFKSTLILLSAGILAGSVNFFLNYIKLQFEFSGLQLKGVSDEWTRLWNIQLLGYIIVGITGAFLTYLINAILILKGLELTTVNSSTNVGDYYYLILLGYGILFGFGTTKLLPNFLQRILDMIKNANPSSNDKPSNVGKAKLIKEECENQFENFKNNSLDFFKSVSGRFKIKIDKSTASEIIDSINQEINNQTSEWSRIGNSKLAQEKANENEFVIGLKGDSSSNPGQIVIVTEDTSSSGNFPTAYWGGDSKTVGMKNVSTENIWKDLSKVVFFGRKIK
jgi:hypothetical protein